MKKQILLLATVFCALFTNAQTFVVDTVPGTLDTSSFTAKFVYDVNPDSTGLYFMQWATDALFTSPQTSSINPITHAVDSFTHPLSGLTSNTTYWIRMAAQTTNLPLLYSQSLTVKTLTAYYLPSLTVDSTVRLDSSHISVYYRCNTGNDTARVRAITAADQNFLFTLNPTPSQFRTAGQTSGVLTVTVPTNGYFYIKVDITNRKGTRPQTPATWTVAPFNYGSQQIIVAPVITNTTASETSITWYGIATNADSTYWLINTDSLQLTGNLPQGLGGPQHLLPAASNSFTKNVSAADTWYAVLVGQRGGVPHFSTVQGITSTAVPTASLVLTVLSSGVDTNSAVGNVVVNTNGHAGQLIVLLGTPTLAYSPASWVLASGTYTNVSLGVSATGLTPNTPYELQVVDIASGDTVGHSNVVSFTTDNVTVLPTAAGSIEVTGVQDQLLVSTVLTSRVQLSVSSENLPLTASLEVNVDWDSTNSTTPITFALPMFTTQTTASVYESFDIAADDVYETWDAYCDQYGRFIIRSIGYNALNSGPYYGDWKYFNPRGVHTDVATVPADERIRVFPNPCTNYVKVEAFKECTAIELYDFMGQRIAGEKKVQKIVFNTTDLSDGFYIVKIGDIPKKIIVSH
jgi:hypothetical protein